MKSVAFRPWTLAAVVVTTLACLAVFSVVLVSDVEAQQQSSASEAEIAARVRAELEARMAQMSQRMAEQMRQLEMTRAVDMERLQREMEFAEQAVRRSGGATMYFGGGCSTFGETVLSMTEELELSDDQVAQIREAQRAVRRDSIARNADVEVGEMDLEALYEADEPDLAAIRAKLEEVALLGVDGKIAGLGLRQQVRAILTPAQRQQFDEQRGESQMYFIVNGAGSSRRVGGFGC